MSFHKGGTMPSQTRVCAFGYTCASLARIGELAYTTAKILEFAGSRNGEAQSDPNVVPCLTLLADPEKMSCRIGVIKTLNNIGKLCQYDEKAQGCVFYTKEYSFKDIQTVKYFENDGIPNMNN